MKEGMDDDQLQILKKALSDPEVKAEYDALQSESDTERIIRKNWNLAYISRIENVTRNPSLSMIKRLAAGMGWS